MELRQLRYFVAVAEDLHFARAAERLHIAQQSLSVQIKTLEDELGTPLLARTTRRVELTPAGAAFLEEIRAGLDQIERAAETARRAGRGQIGRLTVGYVSTALYNVLPPTVRLFRERCPEVEIALQEMLPSLLDAGIRSGKVDAGFVGLSDGPAQGLSSVVLCRDRVMVAVPRGHPLEARAGIRATDLAGLPFVMYSRIHKREAFDRIIAICQSYGFSPNIAQEAGSEAAVLGLVAAGVGVAVVVESLCNVRAGEVSYLPLTDPVVEAEFAVTWNDEAASPLVRALVQAACDAAAAVTPARSAAR